MKPRTRLTLIVGVLAVLAGLGAWKLLPRSGLLSPGPVVETTAGRHLPPLELASGWINGSLTSDSLHGRPVVMVTWSDTDPAALGVLSEAEGWQSAYARFGVRVVGVHTPSFSFGADPAVPTRIAQRLGLTFPIALDPGYQLQRRLGGEPDHARVVVADTSGRQTLAVDGTEVDRVTNALSSAVRALHPDASLPTLPSAASAAGVAKPAPRVVYLGTSRALGGPLADAIPGRAQTFTAQFRFQEQGDAYVGYPVGSWTPDAEGLTSSRGGAANFVAVRSEAGAVVSAVLGAEGGKPVRVWILADETWVTASERGDDMHLDARGQSYVDVDEPRIYRIVVAPKGRVLKLSPEEPGVTFYSFTFEPLPAN